MEDYISYVISKAAETLISQRKPQTPDNGKVISADDNVSLTSSIISREFELQNNVVTVLTSVFLDINEYFKCYLIYCFQTSFQYLSFSMIDKVNGTL